MSKRSINLINFRKFNILGFDKVSSGNQKTISKNLALVWNCFSFLFVRDNIEYLTSLCNEYDYILSTGTTSNFRWCLFLYTYCPANYPCMCNFGNQSNLATFAVLVYGTLMSFGLRKKEKKKTLVPRSTFEIKWIKWKMVICTVHRCTHF